MLHPVRTAPGGLRYFSPSGIPRPHLMAVVRVTYRVPASAGQTLQFSSVEIVSQGGNAAPYIEVGTKGGAAVGQSW